jgi:hypothetical protein
MTAAFLPKTAPFAERGEDPNSDAPPKPSNNPTKPLDDFFRALMRAHDFHIAWKTAEADLGKPGPREPNDYKTPKRKPP